jgi:hypothetical protein
MSDLQPSSLIVRLILRSLGAGHPIRLSIGIAFGALMKIIVDALAAGFPENEVLKSIAGYQSIWFIVVCAPLIFFPMVRGNRNAPEKVVHTINTIQALLDRAKLSQLSEQMFWRALLDKYVAAAKPDLSASPDMDAVFKEPAKEVPISNDQTPS